MEHGPLDLYAIDPFPGIKRLNRIYVGIFLIKIAKHCVDFVALSAETQTGSRLVKFGSTGPGVTLDRVHIDTAHVSILIIVSTSDENAFIVEVGET